MHPVDLPIIHAQLPTPQSTPRQYQTRDATLVARDFISRDDQIFAVMTRMTAACEQALGPTVTDDEFASIMAVADSFATTANMITQSAQNRIHTLLKSKKFCCMLTASGAVVFSYRGGYLSVGIEIPEEEFRHRLAANLAIYDEAKYEYSPSYIVCHNMIRPGSRRGSFIGTADIPKVE